MHQDAAWRPQLEHVTAALAEELGPDLAGVFVHGSAALGGWNSESDLDVLVTVREGEPLRDWQRVGDRLLSKLLPSPLVELSVVTEAQAREAARPWPFLLHLNQGDGRVVLDDGAGDPDLLLHYLVARRGALVVTGREPREVFGEPARAEIVGALRDELLWGLDEADERYVVLNACRALALTEADLVLSKVAGARWALSEGSDAEIVTRALAAQADGRDLGPAGERARAFVLGCIAKLPGS